MAEPIVPVPHHGRRRLWIALAVTAAAVPLLVIDNLPGRTDTADTPTTVRVVAPVIAPIDRPATGPTKGVSVVTSSTTSSTLPITITTTTLVQ